MRLDRIGGTRIMAVQRRVYDKERIANEPGLVKITSAYGGEGYFETLYPGLVVELGDHYLGDGESSYHATVWKADSGTFEQVGYASDRDTLRGRTEVDAPPALMAAWEADKSRRRAEYAAYLERERQERERARLELEARTPRFGSVVRVARGRKVPTGVEGRVFWVSPESDAWGRTRVGFEARDGERIFIDGANLDVIEQPGASA